MRRRTVDLLPRALGAVVVCLVLAGLVGCPDIPQEPWAPRVTAAFNPDPAAPEMPAPIDLPGFTKDTATGLLTVPVPDNASATLRTFAEEYLNRLDGWPVNSALSFEFSGPVEHASVSPSTVVVFDVTGATARRVEGFAMSVYDAPGGSTGADRTYVRMTPVRPLTAGRTYAVVVKGETTRGVQDKDGHSVVGSTVFSFLRSKETLIEELPNPDGPSRIVSRVSLPADTPEGVATLLALEELRLGYAPVFDLLEDEELGGEAVPREEVILLWTFATQSDTIVEYDPTPAHASIPTPNDLVTVDGLVAFPVDPAVDPPAQQNLFEFMNGQDGFSVVSIPAARFAQAVDATTVNADTVRIYDVTVPATPVEVAGFVPVFDPVGPGVSLVITGDAPALEHGHRYAVAVLGAAPGASAEAGAAVLDSNGAPVRPALAMGLLLLPSPLSVDGRNQLAGLVPDADAQQLEPFRAGIQTVVRGLEVLHGLDPEQLAALWTFRVASQGEALYDTDQELIPAPNDLVTQPAVIQMLIAGASNTVEGNFFTWLSEQGGWSAAGSGGFQASLPVEPTTLPLGVHVYEQGVAGVTRVGDIVFDVPPDGADVTRIAFHRQAPWRRDTTYLVLVTDSLQQVGGGALVPSPVTVLLRSGLPVMSETGDNQVPALLGDIDAALLESLRAQVDPILAQGLSAAGLRREEIVAFWTFRVHPDNEMLYNPATPRIPFPNELLQPRELDESSEPARPVPGIAIGAPTAEEDPSLRAKQWRSIASLEGFSTLAPMHTSVLGALAPASLTTAGSLLEVPASALAVADITDLTVGPDGEPDPTALAAIAVQAVSAGYDTDEGSLTITPAFAKPLRGDRRYLVVATDDIESADGSEMRVSAPFWLARQPESLVDETGRSQVGVLGDADAAALEELRAGYAPLFDGLDAAGELTGSEFSRDNILLAWTFWTQGITRELRELRAALEDESVATTVVEGPVVAPTATSGNQALNAVIAEAPYENTLENADAMIAVGRMPSRRIIEAPNFLVDTRPVYGRFLPTRDDGGPGWVSEELAFLLFIPKETATVTSPFPVVLFLHGWGGRKEDVVRHGLADRLLGEGYAVLAIDLPLHGTRLAAGARGPGDGFFAPDLVATRDHFRQSALDVYQVARVLRADMNAHLKLATGQPQDLLATDAFDLLGTSVGAMTATMALATEPAVRRAVLNAVGAHFQTIFESATGEEMQAYVRGTLCNFYGGVGNPICVENPVDPSFVAYDALWERDELSEFLPMAQWILDKADPLAFAPYVFEEPLFEDEHEVLVQIVTDDGTFASEGAQELYQAIGAPALQESYAGVCHAFLSGRCPGEDGNPAVGIVRASAVDDLVSFLVDGRLSL